MAVKREPGKARYMVLRDVAVPAAEPGGQGSVVLKGEFVELDPDTAALLVRDGMIESAEEG